MPLHLQQFICYSCKKLPDSSVFICDNEHIYCRDCAEESEYECRCREELQLKQNPLENVLENVTTDCHYKANGCTWKFSSKDLEAHMQECKFRPYSCIGDQFKIWRCTWRGLQHQITEHFKSTHPEVPQYVFQGQQKISLRKAGTPVFKRINLIDAFNKTFVIYYESDANTKTVSMIIYLLGRMKDADKYQYEMEIISRKHSNKIKFTQSCYSETANIKELIADGKCCSISFNVIKNYVDEKDFIHYRYRMSRKEIDLPTKVTESLETLNASILKCNVSSENVKPNWRARDRSQSKTRATWRTRSKSTNET